MKGEKKKWNGKLDRKGRYQISEINEEEEGDVKRSEPWWSCGGREAEWG